MSRGPLKSAPPGATRGVDPHRITKFLDQTNPWGVASFGNRATQSQRGARDMTRAVRPKTVYDPSLSWDGMAVNPKVFSKFDLDPRVQGKYMLAGARLVETDPRPPVGVLGHRAKKGPGLSVIPPTKDQEDCAHHAGEGAPAALAAASGGSLGLTYLPERFENMQLMPASIGVAPAPAELREAVEPVPGGLGQMKKFLLTPSERRTIQRAEQQHKRAQETAKRAMLQRRRLLQTLRDRHEHGALGVDGIENLESEVYGEKAARLAEEWGTKDDHWEKRKDRIQSLTMQLPRHGYEPFAHNEEFLGRRETKFLQAKKERPTAADDTHDRLFGYNVRKQNPLRNQHLRDRDLYGKTFNPVLNTEVEFARGSIPPQVHDYKFMEHKSQQSLERGRNLQGYVEPGDRSSSHVIF